MNYIHVLQHSKQNLIIIQNHFNRECFIFWVLCYLHKNTATYMEQNIFFCKCENKFTVYTEIYQNCIYAMPLNLKTQIDYLLSQKQYSYKPKQWENIIYSEIQCNTTTVLVLTILSIHTLTELLKFHDTYLPINKKKKKISPSILWTRTSRHTHTYTTNT